MATKEIIMNDPVFEVMVLFTDKVYQKMVHFREQVTIGC